MPRGTLEELILDGLRDRLMAPELVETFIAEFHAEVIDVLQTIIDVGTKDDPDAELEGLKETGGRFLDFDLTTAMIEGKALTLHLEEGRRLEIIPHDAKNFEGTDPLRK